MDPESSFIRVERTFWTVWYYITGAVNRFFRTEPSNIVTNDPNSFQESAVNSEPADSGLTEGDEGRGEVTEKRPHAADSPLSSSKPVASWELCTTDIDLESDEESRQFKTQLSVGSERWTGTGNHDAGLVIAEEAEEEEEEDNKNRVWNLYTHQSETPQCDDDGDQTKMGSLNLRDDAIEEMEGSREEAGDEEETERTMTPDENKKSDDTVTIIHLKKEDYKMHNENEWALEAEDTEVKVCSITDLTLEEEDNMHVAEAAVHRNKGHSVVMLAEVENSDGVLQNKCDEGTKQVENQVSGCKELSDNDQDIRGDLGFATLQLNMVFDKSVIVSEDVEQQHVEPEQEEDIERVIEDSHDEDILTELVICTKEAVQNVITDGLTHDVTTDISLNERFLNESQVEEEICSEEENTESHMGIACATPLFTVKLEGETTLENISLGICETQTVESQELNSPICEETQEGVPEYNNELGSDENITQRFPEVGDCEEIQTTQLQEEVERIGPESRENSGCSAGSDYLLVREQEGEELESTEDINKEHVGIMNITDIGSLQESETALAESPVQEPGLFLDEEEGKSLVHSMKTGIEHSEKEAHIYIEGESDKTIKEVDDATEVCLVEFEIDERLSDSKGAAGDGNQTAGAVAAGKTDGFTNVLLTFFDSEAQEMTDTIFKESVEAIDSDQNSNTTPTLLEDDIESEFLKLSVETEPQLIEACAAETQDAVTGVERTGCGVEEEAAANETQSKYELEILNLQLGENAAEPIKDTDKKSESLLITKSELSTAVESLEARNQLSDEALEIGNEEMLIDIEADELMTTESEVKDLTAMSTQDVVKPVTSCSSSGDQDVIDEEILDLWIQTVQAEDAEDVKQAAPESGQQIDTKTDASNKEEVEISLEIELEKEPEVESNSGESGLLSDTDISSSTAESGFMDQSVSENSETQLLKSSSTDSFQGLCDILVDVPQLAGISELSTLQSESKSQDVLMEEAAEAELSDLKEEESISETGFHPDSGATSSEARHQKQESDKSQEKTGEEHDDSTEAENGSQTDIGAEWKDAEERDVKSPTKMSALFKAEKTEVEDEPFEINATSSPGETKPTESGRSRSSSEDSLEERTVSTESGPRDATWAGSDKLLRLPLLDKPQPTCSEVSESSPELNKADGIEQLTQSEDEMEVDASGLDFSAQRSRIALKNPRVRPPKDPRSLIHMPSVEPTLSSHVPVKVPAGLPLGGLGIGIKLPGLGSGFPVLKKTGPAVKKENNPETLSQEPEAKAEDKSDPLKQDEAQHKPKWVPPRHPGFGNPLMSELKTKLKKPVSE